HVIHLLSPSKYSEPMSARMDPCAVSSRDPQFLESEPQRSHGIV
ncbi:MAG: hypothetical protein QOC58_197, partial [Mycobacterium sp.]|nr:hypothetical protein [Mycobacterium sp.]